MLLTLKLILTPVLIASVTLVGRRWGPSIGGWLMGFPLTSGPVSLLLALQYGLPFAAHAAIGTMAGIGSDCVFCVVYYVFARFTGWFGSSMAAIAGFLLATYLWNVASLPILPSILIVVAAAGIALWFIPRQPVSNGVAEAPKWDMPARMGAAALFVLLLTTFANNLGPQLSGLISPFPVFTTVIAAFTHHQQGAKAAVQLLRGVALGTFAFASFFLVVALLLPGLGMALTYLAAVATTVAINGIALRFVQPKTTQIGE
jgi:hypothetical protein